MNLIGLPETEIKALLLQSTTAASTLTQTTAEAQALIVDLRALIARGTALLNRVERALDAGAAGWGHK